MSAFGFVKRDVFVLFLVQSFSRMVIYLQIRRLLGFSLVGRHTNKPIHTCASCLIGQGLNDSSIVKATPSSGKETKMRGKHSYIYTSSCCCYSRRNYVPWHELIIKI